MTDENELPSFDDLPSDDHRTTLYYESDDDESDLRPSLSASSSRHTSYAAASDQRPSRLLSRSKARNIRTLSNPMATTLPNNNLPSAPASPPTPAPSPSPNHRLPDWSEADVDEEKQHRDFRARFKDAPAAQKQRILAELINLCDSRMLTFVHNIICPRLKKDPFTTLPNEICLRVCASEKHTGWSDILTRTDLILRRPPKNSSPRRSSLKTMA
jgi:hypothetical protein